MCVNRNRGRYCFLFYKGPILNDIRGHSDPKIYARLQEIASNFSKFSGEAPRPTAGVRAYGARFGASPPYRASPFQNFWIRPDNRNFITLGYNHLNFLTSVETVITDYNHQKLIPPVIPRISILAIYRPDISIYRHPKIAH